MEWAYVFRQGEEVMTAFQRKLFTAWLMDMQQNGTYYDIVLRYARAERSLALRRIEDGGRQGELPLAQGELFLAVSSAEPLEDVLHAAKQSFGEGCEGPLQVPSGDCYSVYNTVTFKR